MNIEKIYNTLQQKIAALEAIILISMDGLPLTCHAKEEISVDAISSLAAALYRSQITHEAEGQKIRVRIQTNFGILDIQKTVENTLIVIVLTGEYIETLLDWYQEEQNTN